MPKNCVMCATATGVKVYAGNVGPFVHGCIRYEPAESTTVLQDTTDCTTIRCEAGISSIVIGLAVGLGVAVIILLIMLAVVVAVYLVKRRRAGRKQVADNAMRMSTVSAER